LFSGVELSEANAAEWLTAIGTLVLAIGTLVLAVVAIFQDTIRGWFYHPNLEASIQTRPPDCNAVPFARPDGAIIADSLYLRLWVKNTGKATARNAEVYANELLRERADKTWERVGQFPPMNLQWTHIHAIYFPVIVSGSGKHCDLGHIVDPAHRSHPNLREENPRLNLTDQQTSLAFDLITAPNDKGHIIGPGDYRLNIIIAAENARRIEKTVLLSLKGRWFADETRMLSDGVGVTITDTPR
jgi:hypothetical protein